METFNKSAGDGIAPGSAVQTGIQSPSDMGPPAGFALSRRGLAALRSVLASLENLEAAEESAAPLLVWFREYNVALMAGKRLNVVGEMADDAPIPAAAFKNVVGGNLVGGRHPTHRPFYRMCSASHLFASNVLPPTTDRTEAFFRRWRVVRFSNRIAELYVLLDGLADAIESGQRGRVLELSASLRACLENLHGNSVTLGGAQ